MSNQYRESKGQPTGGQFASRARDDSATTLVAGPDSIARVRTLVQDRFPSATKVFVEWIPADEDEDDGTGYYGPSHFTDAQGKTVYEFFGDEHDQGLYDDVLWALPTGRNVLDHFDEGELSYSLGID